MEGAEEQRLAAFVLTASVLALVCLCSVVKLWPRMPSVFLHAPPRPSNAGRSTVSWEVVQ
jgi:hypothetical protein